MSSRSYKLDEFAAHASRVNCLRISRSTAGVLVTGGEDSKVNIWRIGQRHVHKSLSGLQSAVDSVTIDEAEKAVAAGGANGIVKVWDLESESVSHSLTGHYSACLALELHPIAPLLLSGSTDTDVKVWDLRTQYAIGSFTGHTTGVKKLAISPDGKWACSGSENGEIKLWEVPSGRIIKDSWSHDNTITGIEFHPVEFILATSSTDKTVKIWDLEHFQLLETLGPETTAVKAIAYHRDGKQLITATADALNVWDSEPAVHHDRERMDWQQLADMHLAYRNKGARVVACCSNDAAIEVILVDLRQFMPFCGQCPPTKHSASIDAGGSRQQHQQPPSHIQPLPQQSSVGNLAGPHHEQQPPYGYPSTSTAAAPSSDGDSTYARRSVPRSQIGTVSATKPAAGPLSRQLNKQHTPPALPTGSSYSAGGVEWPLGAPASTDKAAATNSPNMDNSGWHIILQHKSITNDQQLVALLLSTAPIARALVTSLCAGQVPLRCAINNLQTAQQFSQWLQQHRRLAQSIDLRLEGLEDQWDEHHAASLIAAALQQSPAGAAQASSQLQAAAAVAGALLRTHVTAQASAAARSLAGQLQAMQLPATTVTMPTAPELQLRDFRLQASRMRDIPLRTIAAILQQLPCKCLTRLDLTGAFMERRNVSHAISELEDETAVHQALAQLQGLRSSKLQLTRPEMVIPALSSLTQLTDLQLDLHMQISGLLHLLPASLVRLHIGNSLAGFGTAGPIRLEHCSAITELSMRSIIDKDSKLPPNVRDVSISDLVSVEPLLQLQRLKVLHVANIGNEGSELLRLLNPNTQLSCVRLGTCHWQVPGDDERRINLSLAIVAWGQVAALREVKFGDLTYLGLEHVQQFSSLTMITNLNFNEVQWEVDTVTEQLEFFASALQQCKGLQEVVVNGWADEHLIPSANPDYDKLAQALTQLRSL